MNSQQTYDTVAEFVLRQVRETTLLPRRLPQVEVRYDYFTDMGSIEVGNPNAWVEPEDAVHILDKLLGHTKFHLAPCQHVTHTEQLTYIFPQLWEDKMGYTLPQFINPLPQHNYKHHNALFATLLWGQKRFQFEAWLGDDLGFDSPSFYTGKMRCINTMPIFPFGALKDGSKCVVRVGDFVRYPTKASWLVGANALLNGNTSIYIPSDTLVIKL